MLNHNRSKSYKNYTRYNKFQTFIQTELAKVQREIKIKNYSSKTIKIFMPYDNIFLLDISYILLRYLLDYFFYVYFVMVACFLFFL